MSPYKNNFKYLKIIYNSIYIIKQYNYLNKNNCSYNYIAEDTGIINLTLFYMYLKVNQMSNYVKF